MVIPDPPVDPIPAIEKLAARQYAGLVGRSASCIAERNGDMSFCTLMANARDPDWVIHRGVLHPVSSGLSGGVKVQNWPVGPVAPVPGAFVVVVSHGSCL